jgi:hypothetical protein
LLPHGDVHGDAAAARRLSAGALRPPRSGASRHSDWIMESPHTKKCGDVLAFVFKEHEMGFSFIDDRLKYQFP